MKKTLTYAILILALFSVPAHLMPQSSLTIEKIMQGDKFTGVSPESPRWSPYGNNLYFRWTENPDSSPVLYVLREGTSNPQKVDIEELKSLIPSGGRYNLSRSLYVYSKDGDIYLLDVRKGTVKQITSTSTPETSPWFSRKEDKILYISNNNIFSWEIATGALIQLTDIRTGKETPEDPPYRNDNDKWLYNSQMALFRTLAERKSIQNAAREEARATGPVRPKTVYAGQPTISSVSLSPDENYITWISFRITEGKRTIVPDYVTETGYTEEIPARSKVGTLQSSSLHIFNKALGTMYEVKAGDIPGITEKRAVSYRSPVWSDDGSRAVVEVSASDNKDRWITLLDIKTGTLKLLDNQHDSAWIGGPGVGRGLLGWLPDNKTIYFQSEESGFSHLCLLDVTTGVKKQITSGSFEIYDAILSNDKKTWYFISNETDPGIRELYKMPVTGGKRTRITSFGGGVEYTLSPDEKYFALRVSFANKPWELYILENRDKAAPVKITESTTAGFRAYEWRIPDYIRFKASDGIMVPARLYKPADDKKNGAAVIFVHGAGYLQNAHRWWSSYSREYMFHNFLADNGYTVLDIDYRGSAGYGRDWRTAIYRHMGGRDLDDHIDGARLLTEKYGIDPGRIGIYGGSYGGFITLMAMFTRPGVFAAGAALRPVTDWAHYNHGYTSNILNIPVQDSIAYVRSSPIYFAEGFQGKLLICHGMIDDNVHFQDVVRLAQRLIELGKENWELAVYPLENHGFREASSWTDEYKRIYKLFRETLK